jgi:transcriptional regulator of acetoin/glycerol metabolism
MSEPCPTCQRADVDTFLSSFTLLELTEYLFRAALKRYGTPTKAAKAIGVGRATMYRFVRTEKEKTCSQT